MANWYVCVCMSWNTFWWMKNSVAKSQRQWFERERKPRIEWKVALHNFTIDITHYWCIWVTVFRFSKIFFSLALLRTICVMYIRTSRVCSIRILYLHFISRKTAIYCSQHLTGWWLLQNRKWHTHTHTQRRGKKIAKEALSITNMLRRNSMILCWWNIEITFVSYKQFRQSKKQCNKERDKRMKKAESEQEKPMRNAKTSQKNEKLQDRKLTAKLRWCKLSACYIEISTLKIAQCSFRTNKLKAST